MEIRQWREFFIPYEEGVRELQTKFNNVITECNKKGEHSPIETITGRVKEISSILEKINNKQIPFDKIEEEINDIAGIRIICQFSEDIKKVAQLVRERQDMKVIKENDYISERKSSGYRSYHMIILYPVHMASGTREIKVEIQIRTMAMNLWATIEHSLRYKYHGDIPQVIHERITNAAEAAFQLDQEMSHIRSEIIEAQEAFREKANLAADVITNIQNIYLGSEKIAMMEAQAELIEIIKSDDMDKLRKFSEEIDNVAEHHKLQSISH